ncbi:MAG: hypothetical protein ACYC1Q_05155 [Bacteroidia bacterium]
MKAASILFFFVLSFHSRLLAQGGQPYFGQSTRQYSIHTWEFISSDNFDAYYYGDGHHLAELALILAEQELKKIEDLVDYRVGTRSQIILYQSEYDLRHSNLFQKTTPFNPGGYTYVIQNKVIAAFNGNRNDLKRSIRYGIADIIVSELMYGGSFQERLRSSTLLYMPEWFYKGLLSYLSESWNTTIDDQVRDAFLNHKFQNINLLTPSEAEIAGHSWWNYIVQTYGKRSISDILYLTRVSRGYENALTFVLGANSRDVFKNWSHYYELRYASDPGNELLRTVLQLPARLNKRDITQMKLSPDGTELVLGAQIKGRLEIWLFHLPSKKVTRLFRSDDKTPLNWEETEPIIAWNPKGNEMQVFLHVKGQLQHLRLDRSGKKLRQQVLSDFSLIRSASVHPDGKTIVLTAVKNGQSDIYILDGEDIRPLTLDAFDDLDAVFSLDGKEIYFSSNRDGHINGTGVDHRFIPCDSGSSDIYSIAYPFTDNQMKRITATPYIHEIQPRPYAQNGIAYLSDNNGIYNTYVTLGSQSLEKTWVLVTKKGGNEILDSFVVHGEVDPKTFDLSDLDLDSALLANAGDYTLVPVYKHQFRHYPLSNYNRNILHFDTDQKLQNEAALLRYDGKYFIQIMEISSEVENDARYTQVVPSAYRKLTGYLAFVSDSGSSGYLIEKHDLKMEEAIVVTKSDSVEKQLPYSFQTGFPDLPAREPKQINGSDKQIVYRVNPHTYKTIFFPSYLATQLIDNSIINTPYYINNSYSSTFNTFSRPNLNARIEASVDDLFKDQSITAGGRIPLRLYSSDFYIEYIQRKYKRDFGLQFFRSSRLIDGTTQSNRVFIHEIRPFIIQPLPSNFELRFSPFIRLDRTVQNATDQTTLKEPDEVNQWGGARLELILDRHVMEDLNFPHGVRAKVYLEHFQNFSTQKNSTSIFGYDIRWYKKLHAKVLWANRISGAASFGPSLVNYILGGTENWLGNVYNSQLSQNTSYSYIFSTLITGVRGFQQNIRNGGQTFILNSEIRIPITSYLSRNPVSIGFLRTLQWIAFYDIGSAWNGLSPFSDQHYNTRVIDQGAVKITVRNKNNPFVSGVGTGFRTRVFGYYLRADAAWGIENGVLTNDGKAQWYFSLGYDF